MAQQLASAGTAVDSDTACAVLCCDAQAAVPCPVDSKAWLKTAPRGAYTTARTIDRDNVFMLSAHVQRLATSANLMAEADSKDNDSCSVRVQAALLNADELRPRVVCCARAALTALAKQQAGLGKAPGEVRVVWHLFFACQPPLRCVRPP